MRKKLLIVVLVCVLLGGVAMWRMAGSDMRSAGTRSVSVAEFATALERGEATLLDIRTAEEFAQGRIAGARNIDFYQTQKFREELERLDRAQSFLIYCRSGNRSSQALKMMSEMGFADVQELRGGVIGWQAGGKGLCSEC